MDKVKGGLQDRFIIKEVEDLFLKYSFDTNKLKAEISKWHADYNSEFLDLKAKQIVYKKMEEEAQSPDTVSEKNKWLKDKKLEDYHVHSEPIFNSVA